MSNSIETSFGDFKEGKKVTIKTSSPNRPSFTVTVTGKIVGTARMPTSGITYLEVLGPGLRPVLNGSGRVVDWEPGESLKTIPVQNIRSIKKS